MPIFPKLQTIPDASHWAKQNKALQSEEIKKTIESYKNNTKSVSAPQEHKDREAIERKKKMLPDQGYFGEMSVIENKREGRGKQFYDDGTLFEGYFINDELVQGRYFFQNGDVFSGSLQNNQFLKGNYIAFENKFSYKGSFVNDLFHDDHKARLTWSSNEREL